MSPELILVVAQLLLKYGPELAQGFVSILHKTDPTLDDWAAVFAHAKTYDQYVAAK